MFFNSSGWNDGAQGITEWYDSELDIMRRCDSPIPCSVESHQTAESQIMWSPSIHPVNLALIGFIPTVQFVFKYTTQRHMSLMFNIFRDNTLMGSVDPW